MCLNRRKDALKKDALNKKDSITNSGVYFAFFLSRVVDPIVDASR
jgi:hypothetical protein